MARPGTPLARIGTVGLLCGPETRAEHLAHMKALGDGWRRAIDAWRLSEATYCFFLADDAFARPIIFWTSDRAELERGVWSSIAALQTDRFWVVDSLEPELEGFVAKLRASERLEAGHA